MPKRECKDCGGTGQRDNGRGGRETCKGCGGRGAKTSIGLRGTSGGGRK